MLRSGGEHCDDQRPLGVPVASFVCLDSEAAIARGLDGQRKQSTVTERTPAFAATTAQDCHLARLQSR